MLRNSWILWSSRETCPLAICNFRFYDLGLRHRGLAISISCWKGQCLTNFKGHNLTNPWSQYCLGKIDKPRNLTWQRYLFYDEIVDQKLQIFEECNIQKLKNFEEVFVLDNLHLDYLDDLHLDYLGDLHFDYPDDFHLGQLEVPYSQIPAKQPNLYLSTNTQILTIDCLTPVKSTTQDMLGLVQLTQEFAQPPTYSACIC